MAFSKVTLNGDTLMDVTQKTVTAATMLSGTTALKNDGTGITGTIASKSSSDLTASGATVTVPAGYYSTQAIKSVASGSATTPATTINSYAIISVDSETGTITATNNTTKSVTPTVSAGYVSSGTAGTISVKGSNNYNMSVQAATTITPTESEQTAVAAGKYTTGIVKVGAISSTYVGSGIDQNDSDDLTISGATVTAPAGYYASSASKSVASGMAGTPTATKGTVSNHSISVTPSVTNTTGYITGGTKNGTAVSVAASELVSGTKTITENATGIDISEYAAVDVDVDKNLWRITNVGTDTETGATGASDKCVIEDAIPTSLSSLKLFGVAASSISDISGTDGYVRVVSAGKNLLPYDNGTVHLNSGGNDCYITPQADGGLRITGFIVASGIGGYIFYGNYSKLNVPQGSYKIRLTGSGTGFDNVLLQIYSDTGSGFSSSWYGTSYDFTVGSSVLKNYIRLRIAGGTSGTTFDCTVYPILMFGTEEDTTFSPPATTYAVPIDSPGLMGIPVTSGGNVTNTSSNSYVADVIDISAGTLTRNCGHIASYAGETLPGEWIASSTSGSSPATGAKVVYELSDSITTNLTDAQLAVLRSIKPQEGDGTIYTTGLARALMSMGYYQNLISETTQSAQTIHPSTTDQTIASGTYLTGTQTIKAVTTTNLTAANIVSGVTVKIGDSTDDACVASVTGTASGGGGGLTYETGTWTPAEDVANYTILFANTHTEAPFYYCVAGVNDTASSTTNDNLVLTYTCFEQLFGAGENYGGTNDAQGVVGTRYKSSQGGSGGASILMTFPHTDTGDTSTAYPRYWATETGIRAFTNSSSRYWRAGRTYKWIAVWVPTS